MEVKELKSAYDSLEKKHKLPSFVELNENFEIEKIDRESDTMLRTIRKIMMEKIVNSLSFLEMVLNPVNAPRMYFPFIKSMTTKDRELLEKLYWHFSELSASSLSREIHHDEKKEAELIKKTNSTWNELKEDFSVLLEKIQRPQQNDAKKEKSYFG